MTIDPYDDDWIPDDNETLGPPADLERADWMLRQLARTETELLNIFDVFDAEINRLTARRDDLTAGPRRRAVALDTALRDYGLAVRAADGRKRIDLPHGTITTRTGPATVDVDADDLINWWIGVDDADLLAAVVVVPEPPAPRPSKPGIKRLVKDGVLHVHDSGVVVVAETGEAVPGIVWVQGNVAAKVEPT